MYIVSIFVMKRFEEINNLQKILTSYGDKIKNRLGIHDIGPNREGLIIVVYCEKDVENFIDELKMIDNIKVNYMEC